MKNPVFHSKTKHIQIRHYFIRDCYDQRLINVVKVQLFGSQYWYDDPIATFKGRIACKVWTLKADLMLFLRGGIKSEMIDFLRYDELWRNQTDWEIIRWRLNESSGVHTLELEDGTMIHMLAERRYPLSRELMIRMLDHGMEVEDESEIAITLIHLFILWTTEDGDNS
ncbi:hypothetical protein Tco_1386102 [Tanacetum coccineum]